MGYTVEVSFDIKNKSALTMFKDNQRTIADKYNCEMQYYIHDIYGNGKKIKRCDCIHVVIFNDDNFDNIIKYIKYIKENKKNGTTIDCVYHEDKGCELLYVSGRYMQRMEKAEAKEFKRTRRTRILKNERDIDLLNVIRHNKLPEIQH